MTLSLNDDKALVLFSGGQDSATCLAWALERFAHVETIGFDYGQRHAVELACRDGILETIAKTLPHWAGRIGERHTIDLGVLGDISATALTRDVEIAMGEDNLPNTFVPGRNILFLTFAATVAYRRGIRHIVGGMCETDYSGYPDCRDDTIKALQATLNLGMDTRFVLHTPLMWIDKAQTWRLAKDLGGDALVDLILEHSHTCYTGDRTHRHPWGYGCGTCPACQLRAKGFAQFQSHPGSPA
jgi:7-cyano-7-deazaguanine synthase